MTEYAEIKKSLIEKLNIQEARLKKLEDDARRMQGMLSADFGEQAVEKANDDVVDSLGEAARSEIKVIHETLNRIEDGAFGICTKCGKKIPETRLIAMPESEFCLECAEQ